MLAFIPLFCGLLVSAVPTHGPGARWEFVQNGTTGIIGLEAIVISPTLAVLFDRVENDPLQINGAGVWGAFWNFVTNKPTPISLVSDTFCGSGGFLSNGTLVSVGGEIVENPTTEPDVDGRMAIRLMEPCTDPDGVGCHVFDNPSILHLAETRWYPSSLRIFDGSLMVVGGIHYPTGFYNTDPVNSFEFFPPKDNGVPRSSAFLERSLPVNLFPRVFALPDGKVLMIANNQTIIYDIEAKTETRLPDIPNGVRVTNPMDGTATLLPLSPPDYVAEVLVCGGSNSSDTVIPLTQLSSQDPASNQCSRLVITPEGIERGWVVEHMPVERIMPEMVLIPDGKVLIINGGKTGYAAIDSVAGAINGASNADHPVFTPVLYTPDAPAGERFDDSMMPTSEIARLYHSTVTLTPNGNMFIAGSNPNGGLNSTNVFPSEFRAEYLNPPYMSVARPSLRNVPSTIAFNQAFTVDIDIPAGLDVTNVQVALMDLGFSTHAFHSSSRLIFMDAKLSSDSKSMTLTSPPNNRVYPPGPAYIFLTVDGVTSEGAHVLVGNGAPPPVKNQGIPLTQ